MAVMRETRTPYTCPTCQAVLSRENGHLRCETHGMFFAYGPQLVVRLPRSGVRQGEPLLPWESRTSQTR
jgi:uncharacterized Zn finger protein (UPF0148 family)